MRPRFPVIVVDASVLVVALGGSGADQDRAQARLAGRRLVAPEVIELEVVSAWRRLVAAGKLDASRADDAVTDLVDLRLDRIAHRGLLRRCWELRATLTMYDAAYVALAEQLDVPLLTADERLERAPGPRCTFELIA